MVIWTGERSIHSLCYDINCFEDISVHGTHKWPTIIVNECCSMWSQFQQSKHFNNRDWAWLTEETPQRCQVEFNFHQEQWGTPSPSPLFFWPVKLHSWCWCFPVSLFLGPGLGCRQQPAEAELEASLSPVLLNLIIRPMHTGRHRDIH